MDSSPKNVREHIARSKFFLQRGEMLRSLRALAQALELLIGSQIFGRERIEIDFLMEEALRLLMEQESLKRALPAPLVYKKGQERELAGGITRIANVLEDVLNRARKEDRRKRLAELDDLMLAGQAELDRQQPMEARKHFRRAVEQFGDEPGLFVDVGGRLMKAGLTAEAVEHFQKAMELDQQDMRPYTFLVQCHDALHEGEKAEEAARAALRRFGAVEALHLRLARGALERRSWDEALVNAQAALKLNPLSQEGNKTAEAASQHIYGDPKAYQRAEPRSSSASIEVKLEL